MENTMKKLGKLFCAVIMSLVFCVFLSVYGIALAKQDTGITSGGGWVDSNSPETAQAQAIDATGTASSTETQSNSGLLSLTGSYWTGLNDIKHSFTLQNIASTTEDEVGKLSLSWDTLELLSLSNDGNLTVNGIIESTTGGIKFPDGTIQTTAGTGLFLETDEGGKSYFRIGETADGNTVGIININKYLEADGSSNITLNSLLTDYADNITTAGVAPMGSETTTNTIYGLLAGDSLNGGLNNTFIGHSSGRTNVTGSSNVFLGNEAGYNETGSNKLYIANSKDNTLIYGNFENRRVGIGTDDPSSVLHIERTDGNRDLLNLTVNGGPYITLANTDTGKTWYFTHENRSPNDFLISHWDGASGSAPMRLASTGDLTITGDLTANGSLRVADRTITSILEITGGADLSEQFDISKPDNVNIDINNEDFKIEPGMVACIDTENPGKLLVSSKAYDRTVAGIISGAGGVRPGMLMGQKGTAADGEYPVALTGRVYCKADAAYGPIQPGDLLTTSDTPGSVMKVSDYDRAQGATIGKAMSSLDNDKGLVLVLVTLQ